MPGRLISVSELKRLRKGWKNIGKKVVFTNGCFDLIHIGHIRYLSCAKCLGDYLVVGLNTDSSVRRIKGRKRPLMPEKERAEILCALWFVDYVVMFDEDTPERLIKEIEPDVLVKGADWGLDKIVGADYVLKKGGEVRRIDFVKGRSTSKLIEKVVRLYCKNKRG